MEIEIYNKIRLNKSTLEDSSIKNYISKLKSLFYLTHPKNIDIDIRYFYNQDKILSLMSSMNYQTRKNTISALIALINDDRYMNLYKDQHKLDRITQNKEYDNQEKSEKQNENWLTIKEIDNIYNNLYKKIKLFMNNDIITSKNMVIYQDLIILALYTQNNKIVRRNKDFAIMKIRNYNINTDNYIDFDNNKFIFNNYKTYKHYGKQEININIKLLNLIKKFITHNNNFDYLINNRGKIATSNFIKERLEKYLNISSSILRHIYLTDEFKGVDINKMKNYASNYAHSVPELMRYIKK